MLMLDLIATFGAVGLALMGSAIVRKLWRRRASAQEDRARERGKLNAKQIEADLYHLCAACDKPTQPDLDVYEEPSWFHRDCYRKLLNPGE